MTTTIRSPLGSNLQQNQKLGSPAFIPPDRDAPSYFLIQPLHNVSADAFDLISQDAAMAEPNQLVRGKFAEEWDAPQRGSSIPVDSDIPAFSGANGADPALSHHPPQKPANGASAPHHPGMSRTNSYAPSTQDETTVSRKNTLKKKASVRRSVSLKRAGSRRSMNAGSVRSLALQSASDPDETHSAFYAPVPTSGNPTEVLAARFQAWRKILKDLITYFREVQNQYEHRAKSLTKLSATLNNIMTPPGFLPSGGIDDSLQILRAYNKQAIAESSKAREIEEDVILALTGLRSDLHLKIKEIKNLSGDFKNSVNKEMDATRRAVKSLQEVLGQTDVDSSLAVGKQDPYLLRLAVDRQLERQLDEENYLHQAYLNLESSGRELESIVVGEVQKSYNALASILKRDADCMYNAIDELRSGPISMPKDHEWDVFISRDEQFVDPRVSIRSVEQIHYPGRDHYASQELRAGLLERKSKYLKSYTAGWYVLSPTHLHEFKSADKTGTPIMSLYLSEQKLGSHSLEGASSNKFILKGRQTGSMHRGHTWVFRAESHDTMMAWYDDIKALTEKTPQERSEFVRSHSRAGSRASVRAASISSDGVVDDEDEEAFGASTTNVNMVSRNTPTQPGLHTRPSQGGRFPSDDLVVSPSRGLQQGPLSPDSIAISNGVFEGPAAAGIPAATNGNGFTPTRTRSPLGMDPDRYSPMPVPASYPSNLDYDPNLASGTSNTASNPYLAQGSFVSNQPLSTPTHLTGSASVSDRNLPPATPTKILNGTPSHILSYIGNNGTVPSSRPESPSRNRTSDGYGGKQDGMAAIGNNYNKRESLHMDIGSDSPIRPGVVPRKETTQIFSNMHIPGEYPRGINS